MSEGNVHARGQAERTSQQILKTAQRLFAEIGADATSLQMIADEMGLTKAAVYYYFHTKGDVLDEAVRPAVERLGTLLAEAATMRGRRARTEHLVSGYVDFFVDNRHYTVVALAEPSATRHDRDAEALDMRQRALALIFGEHPTPAERPSFDGVFFLPRCSGTRRHVVRHHSGGAEGFRSFNLLHAMQVLEVWDSRPESNGEPLTSANDPSRSRRVGGRLTTLAPVPGSRSLSFEKRLSII